VLEGDIKVPGVGATPKKYVYAGLGVVAIAAGIYYYRKRNATATVDPNAGAEIDAATGYPTGSAQDLAALNQQAATGASGMGGTTPTATVPGPTAFVDNPQWSQAAQDYLVNSVGLDGPTVSAALGVYLAGDYATAAQKTIIEQAEAHEGKPPVAGPNGYPPAIKQLATPGPTVIDHKYVVQKHQIAKAEPARHLVQRFSYTGATGNEIQVALQKSVGDRRNAAHYRNGEFLPGLIYVTVVQKL
jgi:hypothetical protein